MNKLLIKLYAYKFFEDFVLIYPLYAVMFTDHGMAPWQVGTLLTAWSVTAFLLEIPSGVWADKYSRKHLLFFGQTVRALGYLCWAVFPGFWGFLIGFVGWGIESATSSGTFQALVFDELKHLGRETEFTRVIGRCRSISFIAILIASVLASPAVWLGYTTIIILSAAAVFIAGVIILSLPVARRAESTRETDYFAILRTGIREVRNSASLWPLLLFLALATALPGALDEYWTIFADRAGLPNYGLGLFIGLLSGAEAAGSFWAHRLEHFSNRSFYLVFILNGLVLAVAAWWFEVPALILLVVFSLTFTMVQIVFEGRLQHAIASDSRATVSSVSGFITEIGALAVFFSFGWLAQFGTYRMGFFIFGGIITVVGLVYWVGSLQRK
ncbi:MFS transporter [Flavilitoribacter nigricans]|uniref:MFS transporter n=1 Tax=Flavilitoribacter nigricans (strain ATCC 23147 / DSM 23189 / NBRC 102662 / NCIMB 1420 / SS-2) TaxID=1122177 RepID=A0A2D0N1D1_FLAN2|nr:MFS transporter [Flavilitoribacter nigricans]PHN01523.1 hypothetical protein CRP01_36605 [Flavilitoribacter nigricans DSM 23189 = NBRC 102662]